MKYRLPIKIERCVKNAEVRRASQSSDFEQRLRADTAVSCVKKCHHCCYNPITLTILEGVSLFQWLATNRLWTTSLKTKFEQVKSQTIGLDAIVWLLSKIPCPLLDEEEGTCQAYEARPLACRVTYSTGDPYFCHPHRVGDAAGIIPRREVLQSRRDHEKSLLRRVGTPLAELPFAAAVLLGEKICKGEIEIGDYPRVAAIDHLENS